MSIHLIKEEQERKLYEAQGLLRAMQEYDAIHGEGSFEKDRNSYEPCVTDIIHTEGGKDPILDRLLGEWLESESEELALW